MAAEGSGSDRTGIAGSLDLDGSREDLAACLPDGMPARMLPLSDDEAIRSRWRQVARCDCESRLECYGEILGCTVPDRRRTPYRYRSRRVRLANNSRPLLANSPNYCLYHRGGQSHIEGSSGTES